MHGSSVTNPLGDPVFGVLLVAHVGVAAVGFGAMVATGVQGWRAGREPDPARAEALRRYFRPGVNWAARTVYLVPVLGVALVADSGGAYGFGDRFVDIGLAVWVVSVALAETVLWPAERQVQRVLRDGWPDGGDAGLHRACRQLAWCAPALTALFAVAAAVMAARP